MNAKENDIQIQPEEKILGPTGQLLSSLCVISSLFLLSKLTSTYLLQTFGVF